MKKVKSQKYWTPREIQNGKALIKSQNQSKDTKQMDNNCHVPDLVQAFSNVEMKTEVAKLSTMKLGAE